MTTLLITSVHAVEHDTGPGHPESPDRIRVVTKALEQNAFRDLKRATAPDATMEQMARAHPQEFVETVLRAVPKSGFARIDADTVLSPGSGPAIVNARGPPQSRANAARTARVTSL